MCFVIELFSNKGFPLPHPHQIMNVSWDAINLGGFVHTLDELMFFRRLIQNAYKAIQEMTAYFEVLHD